MKQIEGIALFDMDGVLCDHNGALKRDYNKIKGPNDPPFKPFEKYKDIPYLRNRINIIRNQQGWWENLEELQLGFEILDIAKRLKYTIHILTKGPTSALSSWTEKAKWIKKHIPYANITITEDKGLVYGKVLVDDYPKYIERWLEWRPRGLVIMPAQKWDKHYKHTQVIRCDGKNLGDVFRAMEKARDRK